MRLGISCFWLLGGAVYLAALGCAQARGSAASVEEGPAEAQKVSAEKARRVLAVCSDPNNLPFSNEREEGFENRLASLLAKELDADLEYTWWAQGRGFFRNTINARLCDVVMGVPKQLEFVATTDTLYRSSYVFLTRSDRRLRLSSFDDPLLKELKIGVHLIGDDYANTPPVHALGRRGIHQNIVGYRLNADYAEPNPPARLVEAVARGDVDVAIVWGPLGGYFASRQAVPLTLERVAEERDGGDLPLAYDIALGVRRGDSDFRDELNGVLAARRPQVLQILRDYGLPLSER